MYDMRRKVPASNRCVALNLQIFFFSTFISAYRLFMVAAGVW